MECATQKLEYMSEIQSLTRQHITAALIIMITSWIRLLSFPLSPSTRLIIGRFDGWINYFGMLYSIRADQNRVTESWKPTLGLNKFATKL
eukprot:UN04377